jgi:tRNA1Val (adenine37-N6)-methyltransferase
MGIEITLREDEKLDELFNGRLKIIQKKEGYRFSVDALLLAHFSSRLPAQSIIDLGTGSGIIPLVLAGKNAAPAIVGVEVQEEMADMARRTISLNDLTGRVTILREDMRNIRCSFPPSSFDLVVSNPPYYPVSTGRINPTGQKAIARHEIMLSLEDLVAGAHYLVKPTGCAVIIFPAKRLSELLSALTGAAMKPRLLRIIYSREKGEGKLVVVEACKGGNPELVLTQPFFIYDEGGGYSEEMQKIYDEI